MNNFISNNKKIIKHSVYNDVQDNIIKDSSAVIVTIFNKLFIRIRDTTKDIIKPCTDYVFDVVYYDVMDKKVPTSIQSSALTSLKDSYT